MPCTNIKEVFPRDKYNVFAEDGVLKTDIFEKKREWDGMKSKDYFLFDKSKNLISKRTLQNTIKKTIDGEICSSTIINFKCINI